MKKLILVLLAGFGVSVAHASEGEFLVKYKNDVKLNTVRLMSALPQGSNIEELGMNWVYFKVPPTALRSFNMNALRRNPAVEYVQPNYAIKLLDNPSMIALKNQLENLKNKPASDDCPLPIPGLCDGDDNGGGGGGGNDCPIPIPGLCDDDGGGGGGGGGGKIVDNPEIPSAPAPGSGADPLFDKQWGMLDIGVRDAWQKNKGRKDVVVAVIDTGVDYTHEDLIENMWRNPGEMGTDSQGRDKATNGVDDDGNGYIDDLVGWDFASNDNKPFDMAMSGFELLNGGNPGHGTHCAGNVAARGENGKGISGVAPQVSIMAVRFLTEKGQGTTADAVKAITYAVNNGANVLSNSWGSEGEDPSDGASNKALHDAIAFAQSKGVLFIAAAGNGHNGVGYDNDSDAKPGVPASYTDDIIVSVAAIDAQNALGSFSNWGRTSVDIAAPGVKVFSTMVGNNYSDTVIDIPGLITATWDGTSMATPHVAGAAALYLSQHPNATWRDVKAALLKSAHALPALNGKMVSGGKLDVKALTSM